MFITILLIYFIYYYMFVYLFVIIMNYEEKRDYFDFRELNLLCHFFYLIESKSIEIFIKGEEEFEFQLK